jgi:hypothetical protein
MGSKDAPDLSCGIVFRAAIFCACCPLATVDAGVGNGCWGTI